MLHRVTFTINIPPNVSIYTIHGSYGYRNYRSGQIIIFHWPELRPSSPLPVGHGPSPSESRPCSCPHPYLIDTVAKWNLILDLCVSSLRRVVNFKCHVLTIFPHTDHSQPSDPCAFCKIGFNSAHVIQPDIFFIHWKSSGNWFKPSPLVRRVLTTSKTLSFFFAMCYKSYSSFD